jgi:hypothetical protein
MTKSEESNMNSYQLYKRLEEVLSKVGGPDAPVLISVNNDVCNLDQSTIEFRVIMDYSDVEEVIISIKTIENEE